MRTPTPELARLFDAERIEEGPGGPRFNIAPTEPIAVIRRAPANGAREIVFLRWGLLPAWARDPDEWPLLINARAESLHRKPAFRDLLGGRRCLIPADGFYEWRREGGHKQPYLVQPQEGGPMAFAGLWTARPKADGTEARSCVIVTTRANDLLAPIHDRMPVILSEPARELWLDPGVQSYAELEAALQPPPSARLVAFPVSRRVNRIQNDDPECIRPLDPAQSELL